MKKETLEDIDHLQTQINLEWHNYKDAIIKNKKAGEIQQIYLHIKELEKRLDILMRRANELHSGT